MIHAIPTGYQAIVRVEGGVATWGPWQHTDDYWWDMPSGTWEYNSLADTIRAAWEALIPHSVPVRATETDIGTVVIESEARVLDGIYALVGERLVRCEDVTMTEVRSVPAGDWDARVFERKDKSQVTAMVPPQHGGTSEAPSCRWDHVALKNMAYWTANPTAAALLVQEPERACGIGTCEGGAIVTGDPCRHCNGTGTIPATTRLIEREGTK